MRPSRTVRGPRPSASPEHWVSSRSTGVHPRWHSQCRPPARRQALRRGSSRFSTTRRRQTFGQVAGPLRGLRWLARAGSSRSTTWRPRRREAQAVGTARRQGAIRPTRSLHRAGARQPHPSTCGLRGSCSPRWIARRPLACTRLDRLGEGEKVSPSIVLNFVAPHGTLPLRSPPRRAGHWRIRMGTGRLGSPLVTGALSLMLVTRNGAASGCWSRPGTLLIAMAGPRSSGPCSAFSAGRVPSDVASGK